MLLDGETIKKAHRDYALDVPKKLMKKKAYWRRSTNGRLLQRPVIFTRGLSVLPRTSGRSSSQVAPAPHMPNKSGE